MSLLLAYLIVGLIVYIAVYYFWMRPKKEKMTKIRRGVGFLNDADEQPVAAGVIHSAPVLDYTYTYWDGAKEESCDACPNKTVCPECPQFKSSEGFEVNVTASAPDTRIKDAVSEMSAREIMGAAASRGRGPSKSGVFQEQDIPGGPTDHTFESGDKMRATSRGKCRLPGDESAMKVLYQDVMGLNTMQKPDIEDCVTVGFNGHVYKEPCE